MTSISKTDRALLILKAKLANRSATATSAASTKSSQTPFDGDPFDQEVVGRLSALIKAGVDDPKQLARALVESLLSAEFGKEVLNDSAFQRIVERVAGAMTVHEGVKAQIDDIVSTARLRKP